MLPRVLDATWGPGGPAGPIFLLSLCGCTKLCHFVSYDGGKCSLHTFINILCRGNVSACVSITAKHKTCVKKDPKEREAKPLLCAAEDSWWLFLKSCRHSREHLSSCGWSWRPGCLSPWRQTTSSPASHRHHQPREPLLPWGRRRVARGQASARGQPTSAAPKRSEYPKTTAKLTSLLCRKAKTRCGGIISRDD